MNMLNRTVTLLAVLLMSGALVLPASAHERRSGIARHGPAPGGPGAVGGATQGTYDQTGSQRVSPHDEGGAHPRGEAADQGRCHP